MISLSVSSSVSSLSLRFFSGLMQVMHWSQRDGGLFIRRDWLYLYCPLPATVSFPVYCFYSFLESSRGWDGDFLRLQGARLPQISYRRNAVVKALAISDCRVMWRLHSGRHSG